MWRFTQPVYVDACVVRHSQVWVSKQRSVVGIALKFKKNKHLMKLDWFYGHSKLWKCRANHSFSEVLIDLTGHSKLKLDVPRPLKAVGVQKLSVVVATLYIQRANMS